MKKIYFTITGTNYRHGHSFLEPGMEVQLVKEPDNPVDKEAIKVLFGPVGHIGYVAASYKTIRGESWSCGRIYDRIGKKSKGIVKVVLDVGVICRLKE